jgi:6-phosphogluconolactonase (cycloisomerase 2 family)
MGSIPGFNFDLESRVVQQIAPPSSSERFEGVAFSPSGDIIATATSDTNAVLLFRRAKDGRFEATPHQTIGRSRPLDYPHDVSFAACDGSELLAIAQRSGSIVIYAKRGSEEFYGTEPVFEIRGSQSKLAHSDGVAFVPPHNEYLAACNLTTATISFFRRNSPTTSFETTPEFELRHRSIFQPDGLAFSSCGTWLAIANHGNGSVSIFQRRSARKLAHTWALLTVIKDPQFRYPHSVAFLPRTAHLVVTNAGANYFGVYKPQDLLGNHRSYHLVSQVTVDDDDSFKAINATNKMEGGPKGVATHGNTLAVCSPQIGIKIYSFRESSSSVLVDSRS